MNDTVILVKPGFLFGINCNAFSISLDNSESRYTGHYRRLLRIWLQM